MIYLIGGAPKCGKTTLAKKLLKEYRIPWVSADTLQCIALGYTNEKEHKEKFPARQQKGKNNDEKYKSYSIKEIIDAYIKQGKISYPAISMFALSEITESNDYVIEGYQVTPELTNELIKKHGKDKIRAIFLSKTNKDKLIQNFSKSTMPNDWILTGTKNQKEIFPKIADMITLYSKYFTSEAKKYGFKLIEMDDDFNEKMRSAADYLISRK